MSAIDPQLPGLPGQPPLPQGQQPPPVQHQPMQEHYPSVAMSVQGQEDGTRLLVIQVPLPRKVLIFPMTAEEAQEIGGKLAAPSVVRV